MTITPDPPENNLPDDGVTLPGTPPLPEPEPEPREHPEAADGDNDQADEEDETDAGKRS